MMKIQPIINPKDKKPVKRPAKVQIVEINLTYWQLFKLIAMSSIAIIPVALIWSFIAMVFTP